MLARGGARSLRAVLTGPSVRLVDDFLTGRSGIGVHQRRKLVELRNQYTLTDEGGAPAGEVQQVGQSPLAFLLRLFSDLDVLLPVSLAVDDAAGRRVLELRKPWFRLTVQVRAGDAPLGSVRKKVRLGKAAFDLLGPAGEPLGQVRAQDWRARDFRIEDGAGVEAARVTKQWRGLATELFTDADSYAVTFSPGADERMRRLALAAALAVDLTMKQKDR